jgi:SAM-dependent methyltransferase
VIVRGPARVRWGQCVVQTDGMGHERSRFAGGDQAYLRDEQYRDHTRLARRADLHAKYGTTTTPWFDWVSHRLELFPAATVLEVGCGAGWLWQQSTVPVPGGVRLTLTDLSPGMVETAVRSSEETRRFAAVVGHPADLQSLPFPAGSFDRVVANHMLYHLPDPVRGVGELARVVNVDGVVVVATNGRRHMSELWQIRAAVFGTEPVDHTVDVFGAEAGFAMLRDRFADVRWFAFEDELRCTDPADVLAYVCSTPPGEDATVEQLQHLCAAVEAEFVRGAGTMTITKDTGCFVCRTPRAS